MTSISSSLVFGLLLLVNAALSQADVTFGSQLWRNRHGGARRHTTQRKIPNLGVNYGLLANNLPAPEDVSHMLQETFISSIKLYSADSRVLHAFSHTSMTMVVGVPDEDIPVLGSSSDAAIAWVNANIVPFYPATNIVALVVGNEVLSKTSAEVSDHLVEAMENLYNALLYSNIQNISVSTTHSLGVLATSYPPSAAQFQSKLLPLMKRILSFLSSTSSPFMSNSYPYFAYKQNSEVISLDYALFRPNDGFSDPESGLHYSNLFDAQVDAIYYAMQALGFNNIPVVVAESGWPSAGDSNEVGASVANAQEYNSNLIKHIASNRGTPANPNVPIYTYIFALFNENLKPGPTSEQNFGLFDPNETQAYNVGLQINQEVPPAAPKNNVNSVNSSVTNRGVPTWCIARPGTPDDLLQQILDYACGEGGANCKPIQAGGDCFDPDTLASHASYAMNSYYYQGHDHDCHFNGGGMLSPTNPSYGDCIYPFQR